MVERPLPAAGRGRSLQRATRCARGRGESAGQHHGIDDLDNTVGLQHVADSDFGGITLGIDDPELFVLFLDCQRAALHRFQRCLSATGIDLLAQVLGGEAAWHDVIGQHVDKSSLGRCALYPQKRTLELTLGMSALCH